MLWLGYVGLWHDGVSNLPWGGPVTSKGL
jgi:hypothetical protein